MLKVIFSLILFIYFSICILAGSLSEQKKIELKELERKISVACMSIRNSFSLKAGDFLNLLPRISVSRGAVYGELPESEYHFSASVNTSQFARINDAYKRRAREKRKALRKVRSLGYRIRKLIERKFLFRWRMWKLLRMRGSMENPVEIAGIDEKIDSLKVKIQETEIDIERSYGEIEFIIVEAGG